MIDTLSQFRQILKKSGYSVTQPRVAVFQALQSKEPLTMQEIISSLGVIDRASVYRTVSLFEKLRIVQRMQIGWKYKIELTDHFHSHHHHIACQSCGKVTPISAQPGLETIIQQLAQKYGFRLESHQLEMSGICPNCLVN